MSLILNAHVAALRRHAIEARTMHNLLQSAKSRRMSLAISRIPSIPPKHYNLFRPFERPGMHPATFNPCILFTTVAFTGPQSLARPRDLPGPDERTTIRSRYSAREDAAILNVMNDAALMEKLRAGRGSKDGVCAYVQKYILPNRNRGSINYRVRLLKSRMSRFSSIVATAALSANTNESKPEKLARTKRIADWTPELSKQLIAAVEMYGPKWAMIANDEPFKGFRSDFLYEAYWVSMANAKLFDDEVVDADTKLNMRKKRGVKLVWTKELDELLLHHMTKLGVQIRNPWVQLAQKKEFEQFTPKQIFAHWHEVVDPYKAVLKDRGGRGVEDDGNAPPSSSFIVSVWTPEEDAILLKAYEEYRKHMPTNNIEGPTRINLASISGPSAVRFSLIRAHHPELAKYSTGQISQRINRLYQAQAKTIPWTPEEDKRILQFKTRYPIKTPWRLFYQLKVERENFAAGRQQSNLPALGDVCSDHGVFATIVPASQASGVMSSAMLEDDDSETIQTANSPIWRTPMSLYMREKQLNRPETVPGKFSEEENAVLVKMFRELNGNLFSLNSRENKDVDGNTIDFYDFLASDKFVPSTWRHIASALNRDPRRIRPAAHKIWDSTVGANTDAPTAINPVTSKKMKSQYLHHWDAIREFLDTVARSAKPPWNHLSKVVKVPANLLRSHVYRQSVSLPLWNQTADTLLISSVTKILQNTLLAKDADGKWHLQYIPPLAKRKSTIWPLPAPFLDHVKSLEKGSIRAVLLRDGMNGVDLARETEAAVQKRVTEAYKKAGLAEGTDFWPNLQQDAKLNSQKKSTLITVADVSPIHGGISKKRTEALMEHHHLLATHVILWDLVALELNGKLKDLWFQDRNYSCHPVGDDYREPQQHIKKNGKPSRRKTLLNLQFDPKRVERRWRVLRKQMIWNTNEW
ncbi:hypothetical protein BJ741DRAFT_619471 [Chytriomyces cf. hyalinus JEL632]|nr:hypothetical protein BJ741DRAFT_619471 [Chytriomyces cf. hyalinus JEL632]